MNEGSSSRAANVYELRAQSIELVALFLMLIGCVWLLLVI